MASTGINITLDELLTYQTLSSQFLSAKKPAMRDGQYLTSLKGRGIDFSEVRQYLPGDDIRLMDWRVTARTGIPHIKCYHEEKERPVLIVLDFSTSMYFGTRVAYKTVTAARLAALLAFAFADNGDRIGGLLFHGQTSNYLKPKPKIKGVLPFLNIIANCSQASANEQLNFDHLFFQLHQLKRPGTAVIIISDFLSLTKQHTSDLVKLAATTDLQTYLISDPIEVQPPPPGVYTITDGHNSYKLNTYDKSVTHQYQKLYQTRKNTLASCLPESAIIEISTKTDLIKELPSLLYRGNQ